MKAHGFQVGYTEVEVRNARHIQGNTFYERGFALLASPTSLTHDDFFNHDKVVNTHYEECVQLLKNMGAASVLPFDYIVRSVEGKQIGKQVAGGQGVQGPAPGAH